MHRVFLSFHHDDQVYKDALVELNRQHLMFIDGSVDTGDISDELPDESIRQIIRDDYLRDTTVSIVLIGQGTKGRKHVDWEIYSSMFDGKKNKRSGIVAVLLPGANPGNFWTAAHENEKSLLYPDITNWMSVDDRAEYERRYTYLPNRVIDNLLKTDVKLSVVPWDKLNTHTLPILINNAFEARTTNNYDLNRPMRRNNR